MKNISCIYLIFHKVLPSNDFLPCFVVTDMYIHAVFIFLTASRIVAKSTTAGTPVKSCIKTRAGEKAISILFEDLRKELCIKGHLKET